MSAPIQVRREGDKVVLDLRDGNGDSIVALRMSPVKALEVALALVRESAATS